MFVQTLYKTIPRTEQGHTYSKLSGLSGLLVLEVLYYGRKMACACIGLKQVVLRQIRVIKSKGWILNIQKAVGVLSVQLEDLSQEGRTSRYV